MNNQNSQLIGKYLSDQLALEKHTLECIETHLKDADLKGCPEAQDVLNRARIVLSKHVTALENLGRQMDVSSLSTVKEAVTNVTSTLAGLYGKLRSEKVSKFLRDDHVALTMISTAYSMLHATALAYNERELANMTLQHLKEITPLVMESSNVVPMVVVKELAEEDSSVELSAGQQAANDTREAWKNPVPVH
jgi:hypothetical protein